MTLTPDHRLPIPGTVLDASRETAEVRIAPASADSRAVWLCPECLTPVHRLRPHKLFCCEEHRRAWNNRWMTRGAVLAQLIATARETRGGHRGDRITGARARGDAEHLVQRWKNEDADLGRMPIATFVAERYRLGLVEVA